MPPDEQKHFNKIKLEKLRKIEDKQERFRIEVIVLHVMSD
jgi:hypothetical protein